MSRITGLGYRLRQFLHRAGAEVRMEEELRFHLEMETEKNLRAGMSPEEARRRAVLSFGGLERYKEEVREGRGFAWIESGIRDVRYAARSLRRSPGFALTAVVILGLGIGGNAALFTALSRLFRHQAPGVAEGVERVWLTPLEEGRHPTMMSYPDFRDFVAQSGVFRQAAAWGNERMALASGGPAERVQGQLVTPGYFELMGVRPLLGRGFLPDEDTPARAAVVVLGERIWREAFGGDPAVIGRKEVLDGQPFTVVGVVPAAFTGAEVGDNAALWVPMAAQPILRPGSAMLEQRNSSWLAAAGRLRPGVSLEQADAALEVVRRRLTPPGTEARDRRAVAVYPMHSSVRPGQAGEVAALIAVAGAVTLLVLLVAFSNFATLLIGRGAARREELAVRQALGAGRGRIVRLLLMEVALLVLAGGAAGVLLSLWITAALSRAVAAGSERLVLHPDVPAVIGTFAFALLTGMVFGVAPALQATRLDLSAELRDRAGRGGRRSTRLRRGLVTAQLALSLLLLVGSGLFLRSLGKAMRSDVGFDARQNVLAATFDLATQGYAPERRAPFEDELLRRAASLPEVESATLATVPPLSGIRVGDGVSVEGRPDEQDAVFLNTVTPGYFRTLGSPLVAGRDFTDRDDGSSAPVVLVNEAFARRWFGGASALGKRIRVGGSGAPLREIVGVARDARYDALTEEPRPFVFLPLRQTPRGERGETTLLVRVRRGSAAGLAAPARRLFAGMDPNLPVFGVTTMEGYLDRIVADRRFGTRLLALFGALSLLLSAVGLYGLTAFSVTQRRYEIGLRVALGARRADVLRLFVGEGLRLTLVGLGLGLVLAAVLTRFLARMLYGITPLDLATFAGVAALLAATSLAASYAPARRAATLDPARVLRVE